MAQFVDVKFSCKSLRWLFRSISSSRIAEISDRINYDQLHNRRQYWLASGFINKIDWKDSTKNEF